MSISLLLIPAALAAAAAVGTAGVAGAASMVAGAREDTDGAVGMVAGARGDGGGPTPVSVRTRMKDPDLLAAALADLGATSVAWQEGALRGVVDGMEIEMARSDDGVWGAHLRSVDGHEVAEADAAALIGRLDAAYAAHVQRTVAERIRSRAGTAGFELVSETRDDADTLTMVLAVKDHA